MSSPESEAGGWAAEAPAPPLMSCPSCGETSAEGLQFCPRDGSRLHRAPPAGAGARPPTRPSPPTLIGRVIGDRYRIVGKLGEGGMGEVYQAEHVYIDRRVAIKTLRPEIVGSADAVARFQQEARAASMIGHQNIVAIEDFGQLPEGGVYMAMEYLEGMSLAERLRQGQLPRAEAMQVMMQVCRGLGAAHDKGIVHRDMKPENVFLVRRDGHTLVKILDFGIAKVQGPGGGQAHLTQTGAVFGTPYYMSPEQALGRPLDARTDVYSVGVILYELFAGRVPFEGDSFVAILSQHITTPPTPPSQVAPGRHIPPMFERLILRAMAKEPDQRFATISALAEALAQADARAGAQTFEGLDADVAEVELAEQPPNRVPGSGTVVDDEERARRGRRQRRGMWVALALLLLGAAGLTARGWLAAGGGPTAGPRGKPATVVDPALPADAPSVEVVLESIPTGAKVLAGGRVIAETPEVLRVALGKPLEVLLHKDGYAPRQLSIDPARDGHKVVVKLEREQPRHPHGGAGGEPGARPRGAPVETYQALPPPSRTSVRPAGGATLDPHGR